MQVTSKRVLFCVISISMILCLWYSHVLDDAMPPFYHGGSDIGSNNSQQIVTDSPTNTTVTPIWRFRAAQSHRKTFNTIPYPPLEKRTFTADSVHQNDSSPKILLFWTKLFKSPTWGGPLGKERFKKCPYNNCRAESDHQKYWRTADMFLFYQTANEKGFPPSRTPKQIYTVVTGESPCNAPIRHFNYRINLTVTDRLESDVVMIPHYVPKEHAGQGSYVPKVPFKKKTRAVSWMVSHCKTVGRREVYAKALSEYIDVDIYGACGPLKCKRKRVPPNNACFEDLEQKYLFYLSFENSICKDYATEKIKVPLRYDIVPIVLGGGNYTLIAPPNSFIDAADFQTPKDLADYLRFLSENEAEYMKYLQWKQDYDFAPRREVICDLCEIMMKGTFQRTAETWDVAKWWEHNACDNDLVARMLGQ